MEYPQEHQAMGAEQEQEQEHQITDDSNQTNKIIYHDIDPSSKCRILLNCESEDHIYRVSSSALRLASPVLAKLADPNSRWAKKDAGSDEITLTLENDDPEALDILFKLMHFQQKLIPQQLGLKKVFNLAVVCDKYDCVHIADVLIKDLADQLKDAETDDFWTQFYTGKFRKVRLDSLDQTKTLPNEKAGKASMLLYVAYVFDLEKIFPHAYAATLLLWDGNGTTEGHACLPDRVFNQFMAHWEAKKKSMVEPITTWLQDRTFGLEYGQQGKCIRDNQCTLCDISLYGSFIRRMNYMGVHPIEEKSKAMSLHELGSRIMGIQIGRYRDPNQNASTYPHDECIVQLFKKLKAGVGEGLKKKKVELKDVKDLAEKNWSLWE